MRRSTIRSARPQVEQLEDRQLLAGHITFNPALGMVSVQGTARNDTLTVAYAAGGTIRLSLTGGARQTARLPASAVREVVFHGNGGRDRFRDFTAVPVFFTTRPGNLPSVLPGGRNGFTTLQTFGDAGPSAPAIQVTPVPGLTNDEALILEETNDYRTSLGLQPLTVNPLLEQMAHGLATAEATADRYGDTDTDGHIFQGHDPVWRAAQVGYAWSYLGENVAYNLGYTVPAQELMDEWWTSPPHQANILDPHYTEIGVGVAVGASGRTYGVQDFGAPG
jgi:uncharacterized protein YkwD